MSMGATFLFIIVIVQVNSNLTKGQFKTSFRLNRIVPPFSKKCIT
jgi:hypothetical protein